MKPSYLSHAVVGYDEPGLVTDVPDQILHPEISRTLYLIDQAKKGKKALEPIIEKARWSFREFLHMQEPDLPLGLSLVKKEIDDFDREHGEYLMKQSSSCDQDSSGTSEVPHDVGGG